MARPHFEGVGHFAALSAAPLQPRTTLTTLAFRGLVLLLGALAVLGQLAHFDTLYWNAFRLAPERMGQPHPSFLTVVISDAVLTAVTATLAVMMAFKSDGDRGAYPFSVALAAWSYLLAYSGIVVLLRPDSPASPMMPIFAGHFMVVEMMGLAGLLAFSASFPRKLSTDDLQSFRTLPVGLRTAQRFRQWLLNPEGPWLAGLGAVAISLGVNQAMGRPLADAPLLPLVDVIRFATLAVVILNLRRAYVLADPAERTCGQWIVVGFALLMGSVGLLIGGNVLVAVTGWSLPGLNWRQVVLSLGVVGLLWGISMGVFYEGETEPARVARRTVLMSALATLALLLGAGLEALFSDVLVTPLALPGGFGVLVSVAIAWTVYVKLGTVLDRVLERAFRLDGGGGESQELGAGYTAG